MIYDPLHDIAYKKTVFFSPQEKISFKKTSTVLLMLLSPHLFITKNVQTLTTSEQNLQ